MTDAGSQVEKLVGSGTMSLQRFRSLVPIDDGIKLTDRFQLAPELFPDEVAPEQSPYIVIKETRGEHHGRILMFPRHLVDDVQLLDCAGDPEWCITLRAPFTVETPPSGFLRKAAEMCGD